MIRGGVRFTVEARRLMSDIFPECTIEALVSDSFSHGVLEE
jgi:hypothetical protein